MKRIEMENLRKDYPNLFKRKEVIVTPKPPHTVVWHDNVPTVVEKEHHYEVRKMKDSSPIILSKNYKL